MTALPAETLGLRERKKVRTRERIREVALRLFLEQGYEATTVQQVADAAEVSLSTLFRYFPTKARLVLPADLDTLIAAAFRGQGPDASVFDVIESAIRSSFDQILAISDAEARDERVSYTLARAREALLGEATGTIGLVAQLIGERWGRDPHDPLVQAAAGSVVGVGLAAWTADRDLGREEALRILRNGFDGLKRGFRP
jgi:AcrR family transcriptional regulator